MTGERAWPGPVLTAALTLTLILVPTAHSAAHPAPDPQHTATRAGVAGHYIVVLKGRLPKHPTKRSERKARAAEELVAASVGAKPDFDYVADLFGFAAKLTRSQVRRLRHDARVKYVERDTLVDMDASQTTAPWHLDRIDQRSLPLDSTYTSSSQGAGVHVYILDTGIETRHPDFGARAEHGFDSFGGGQPAGTDCNGHGTHVAGLAGGTTYGVAKLAMLVSVRVLGCGGSGTMSGVIAGVDWVTAHHAHLSVANMSLGSGAAQAMDTAVQHLVESGVFVAVAAGNSNANACNYSPARAPTAFTTAASDSLDRKSSFSNHGPCVDAYAPGSSITSDWIRGTNTISGTSMAAPLVAGAAALYLAQHHSATPADVTQWLTSNATTGVIRNDPTNTANRLLFMGGL